ncbi:hypothetical protein CCACVL1_26285 [Corchorus capsularis]|uniref:Lipase, GDSL n=1 Tax=Corchorus capsularis TaxID=210143 RepID=A0A1R3GFA7_COCAP|nr:hypothetical protein CCACVL1_26285 [Corchorus capsularis]
MACRVKYWSVALVNRLGLDIQIDYYNITRKQFDKLLGPSKAKDYISKRSIFSVTIGANDFLNNYLLPVLSIGARISESPDAFIEDMISHLRNQLTKCKQWSEKSGKRLEEEEGRGRGGTEEESDADMTRPKSEGRPNNCTPRCPTLMILSLLSHLHQSLSISILFFPAIYLLL